jgi:hypothetical protein
MVCAVIRFLLGFSLRVGRLDGNGVSISAAAAKPMQVRCPYKIATRSSNSMKRERNFPVGNLLCRWRQKYAFAPFHSLSLLASGRDEIASGIADAVGEWRAISLRQSEYRHDFVFSPPVTSNHARRLVRDAPGQAGCNSR